MYVVAASCFPVSPFEDACARVFETDDTTAGKGFFTRWLWRETKRLVEEGIFRGDLQVGSMKPFHAEIRFAASRGESAETSRDVFVWREKSAAMSVSAGVSESCGRFTREGTCVGGNLVARSVVPWIGAGIGGKTERVVWSVERDSHDDPRCRSG